MKKYLACFLILAVSLFTLCSCASEDVATAPPIASSGVDSQDESEMMPSSAPSTEPSSQPTEDNDPSTETEPTQITAEGIVLMSVKTSGGSKQVQLICIDPETGEQEEFLHFTVSSPYKIASMPVLWASMPLFEGAICGRFSSDFTRLAATRSLSDSTEEHAGWIDAAGNFFDVTVALGLEAKSDFADPPVYYGIGFSADDEFIYADYSEPQGVFYAVPMDNVSNSNIRELGSVDDLAIALGAPQNMQTTLHDAWDAHTPFAISDQLNDGSYVATFSEGLNREHGCSPESAIIEINPDGSFTRTEYIPEASRFTWSGKLSPDGTQIAFLSCITEVTYDDKPTELFIGSVDGSEPTKVPCELPDTEHEKNHNGIYTMAYGDPSDVHYYCAIVGWK